MMANVIVIAVIAAIAALAVLYIIREKKRGKRCIGCSCSGSCHGMCRANRTGSDNITNS